MLQSATGQVRPLPAGQSPDDQFGTLPTASGESGCPASRPFTLSWTHYVFLLRVKDPNERSFYEIEAAGQNWTVREPIRQGRRGGIGSGKVAALAEIEIQQRYRRRLGRLGQTGGGRVHVRRLSEVPLPTMGVRLGAAVIR